jgi:hypothetical protein
MTKLVWAFVAARGCAAHFTYTHTNAPPYPVRRIARIEEAQDSNYPHLSFLLSSHPPHPPPPPTAAPPLDLHHGLAQHLQQWPKHHTELSERRQFAAAVRCSSKFAHIWPMGRIRSGCPTSQRISERRRQGERFEGSEHRRYVQSTSRVPIVSYSAIFSKPSKLHTTPRR